jgi:hypothetical protein
MKKWIFCAVVGLALLVLGVSLTGDPVVRCGAVPMSPGAVCQEATGSGEVVARKTYDEVEKETVAAQPTRDAWGLGAFVGGAVLILLAVAGVVVRRRRRAKQEPSPADLFFQRRAAAARAALPLENGPPTRGADTGSGDDANPRPT